MICIGIAGVVAVLISVLAMANGLGSTLASSARDDRVIVLGAGTRSESISFLTREDIAVIEAGPGIHRTLDGQRAVSAEILLPVNLPSRATGRNSTLMVRGLTSQAPAVRPEIHLIAGRMFTSGLREIVAGRSARAQFVHLDIGESVRFYNGDWKVVGLFESGGDARESEVLTDADTLMSASRHTLFSAATVTLEQPSGFDPLKDALLRDKRLKVDVERETEHYARRSKQAQGITEIVGTTIAAIMAIGALLGALNTMYAAVSARGVEIATLRALGFGPAPVVVSVLIEAQLLSLIGGLVGAAIAWLSFNGIAFTTGGTDGQIEGRLRIDAPLIQRPSCGRQALV